MPFEKAWSLSEGVSDCVVRAQSIIKVNVIELNYGIDFCVH